MRDAAAPAAQGAVRFRVNGEDRSVAAGTDRPLLEVLREDFGLLGVKYGCGESRCGACSVLVDGRRVFSCQMPAAEAEGKAITTIEGLADGDNLTPVQQAFLDEGAFQCGFCTAGMIVAATALLAANPHPTDSEIVAGMNRNLCRCCGYPQIIAAVRRASGRKGA